MSFTGAHGMRRDRGVTMLVRVDVSGGAGGVLLVTLSHQAAGFAPYRLDNFSCETLHLRYSADAARGLFCLAMSGLNKGATSISSGHTSISFCCPVITSWGCAAIHAALCKGLPQARAIC